MNAHDVNNGEAASPPLPLESTLDFLAAVERAEPMSQRDLAQRLGVALGFANALVRRCLNKGLVKLAEAPARRYVYYLTPAGFSEKTRLVRDYVAVSLNFFRSARADYAQLLAQAAARGDKRILLWGSGELAEIALLAADGSGVALLGVIDATRNAAEFHRLPIYRSLAEAPPFDLVVLADAKDAQAAYAALVGELADDRILAPGFLHVLRSRKEAS